VNPRYPAVAERAGHRCEYCRAPETIFNLVFEVEHLVPTSRGGSDDLANLALACRACNLHKADQVDGRDEETGSVFRLFDPRAQRWEEHFAVDAATGAIRGSTAVGRVTVACLQMNRPPQLAARLQWMRLAIFP
jgi:hypothetical protein